MYLVRLDTFNDDAIRLNDRVDTEMILPYQLPVGWFDDDWFRFYYDSDGITVAFEIHELDCSQTQCKYRDEPCSWHSKGCDCSNGACQH